MFVKNTIIRHHTSRSNSQLSFGFLHCIVIECPNVMVAEEPSVSICGRQLQKQEGGREG
jgi:hypothetical protein